MDINTLIDVVVKQGLGVASFVALVFFGYKAGGWAQTLLDNHLAHIQASLDQVVKNSTDANEKLDKQTGKLDEILKK